MFHQFERNFILLTLLNVGNFILQNFDKIAGSTLTCLSIGYLVWKWRYEYIKYKAYQKSKNENK